MIQRITGNQGKKLSLFLAYCKIGLIGFGGGSALIPVIEKETVERLKAVSEEDYTKHTIIANITPGTLPTKLGALSSCDASVACAYGGTLPGVALTIVLLSIISFLGKNALTYLSYASVGIIVFILFLLVEYIQRVIRNGQTQKEQRLFIILALGAFFLTGGKEIRSFLGTLFEINNEKFAAPVLDIAAIDLMIITFFILCFLGRSRSKLRKSLSAAISILYIGAASKSNLLGTGIPVPYYLKALMLMLAIAAILYDSKNAMKAIRMNAKNFKPALSRETKPIISSIIIFASLIVVFYVAAALAEDRIKQEASMTVADFSLKSILATCTSFGGGEAFISIADGIFIENGYLSAGDFYSQTVPVANALPGPILVKILAGIGYGYGAGQYNNPLFGWALALLGTAIGVGCSSILALLVMLGFDSLKDSVRLKLLKKYILPVVCGLLITTSVSMLREVFAVFREAMGNRGIGYGCMIIPSLYLLAVYGVKKLKLPDVAVFICAAFLSLAAILILTMFL